MPSLRIPYPEQETASTITLRGQRITVGRLPDNTIQLRDRTISAYHAELIEEGDHYRVHDLGATNGLLVDGQPVTDFHLREACKVTFGGVECEFSPEVPAAADIDPTRALVTRVECDGVTREAEQLRQKVSALREEIELLNQSRAAEEGEQSVARADFDRMVGELAAMKEALSARERDHAKMTADLAVFQRDRANLQRALKDAQSAVQAKAAAPAQPKEPAEVVATPIEDAPLPVSKPQPLSESSIAPAAVPIPVKAFPKTGGGSAEPAIAASAVPSKKVNPLAYPKSAVEPGSPLPKPPSDLPSTPTPAPFVRPNPASKPSLPQSASTQPATPKGRSGSSAVVGPKGTQKVGV